MFERLLIIIGLALLAAIVIAATRTWYAYQMRRLARQLLPQELSQWLADGHPALLYFTASNCAQCRFQQAPILQQLSTTAPIQICTVDAVEHENLARHFGIMTVPTTIVLDRQHKAIAVNHGLAPLPQLQQQIQPLLAA